MVVFSVFLVVCCVREYVWVWRRDLVYVFIGGMRFGVLCRKFLE